MMEEVSAFGGGSGGSMMRLALSEEDRSARDWFGAWIRREGLDLQVDAIGNVFGVLKWAAADAPIVMTGSHLDSQPNGGRFDGAYGVVAACAAVQALKSHFMATGETPKANLAVVNWTNEEGTRFQPSLLGSGVYAGEIDLAFALDRRDGDGISVSDALDHIGYRGASAPPIPAAFIELHIEGDTKLEKQNMRFAAFTRFWGATKHRLAFVGQQAHTGPTPMVERRDALLAAAYFIAELRHIGESYGTDLHTSVGRLELSPNSPNIVPAQAVCFVELRSGEPDVLERAERRMLTAAREAADRAKVSLEIQSVDRRRAGSMDERLVKLAEASARDIGESTLMLDSMNGHDAISMAAVCPSIVLAVPSVGGVIHHPDEFTSEADRELGATILARMLWRLCADAELLETFAS